MSQDGAIDYRRYSTAELREALTTIDRSRFPLNLVALEKELAARADTSRAPDQIAGIAAASLVKPDQPPASRSNRPKLVWVLLVFYALIFLAGGPIFYAVTTGAIDLPDPIGSYYRAFGFWDFVRVGVSYALIAAVMIALFRMKRVTLYLALAAWIYGVLVEIFKYQDLVSVGATAASLIVGNILGLLIVYYFWHLYRTSKLT